jgi:chorismate mutase/prephenate dehydratase
MEHEEIWTSETTLGSAVTAEDLDSLRKGIDDLDRQLLVPPFATAAYALAVGDLKKDQEAPIYRPEREAQVIARLQAMNGGPLPPGAIEAIWREVMSACRSLERRLRVAYLGPEGTFSEQAMRQHFGAGVEGLASPHHRRGVPHDRSGGRGLRGGAG